MKTYLPQTLAALLGALSLASVQAAQVAPVISTQQLSLYESSGTLDQSLVNFFKINDTLCVRQRRSLAALTPVSVPSPSLPARTIALPVFDVERTPIACSGKLYTPLPPDAPISMTGQEVSFVQSITSAQTPYGTVEFVIKIGTVFIGQAFYQELVDEHLPNEIPLEPKPKRSISCAHESVSLAAPHQHTTQGMLFDAPTTQMIRRSAQPCPPVQ